jgi:hypothetical protein
MGFHFCPTYKKSAWDIRYIPPQRHRQAPTQQERPNSPVLGDIQRGLLNIKTMAVEIITKEDLMRFKRDLLVELKEIIKEKTADQPQWIKSPEDRKLLKISPGTLQNLRINGTLPYTKIGGVVYYSLADIEKVMQSKKIHNK